jgi:hypothetical protein
MAKFISIATTITATPTLVFNAELISFVSYVSATSLVIYVGTKTFTLTVAGATTTSVYNAINDAITNPAGPITVPVKLNGATVSALVIA